MERLRAHFYASLLKSLAYLKIRYGSLHIELYKRDGHYYLLISSNYIHGAGACGSVTLASSQFFSLALWADTGRSYTALHFYHK